MRRLKMTRDDQRKAIFDHDVSLFLQRNKSPFAGIDEAGRGPLVGCVMAACVILPLDERIPGIDDSKKLSALQRDKAYDLIMKRASFVQIGRADAEEIDQINILNATKNAMCRSALNAPCDLFLIDAVPNVGLNAQEQAILHGDAISYMIAAASIVAKVTRDREMLELDKQYPDYGFARNKGYGTKEHIQSLMRLGPCPAHRKSFIRHFQPV